MAQMAMAQENAEEVMLGGGVNRCRVRKRRHLLVILGPPAQETSPDIVVEDVGDRDGGPNVCHVERCPDEATDQENGNVEVGENLEPLSKEVEWDR